MSIGRFYGGVGALIWNPDQDKYLLLKRSAQKDFAAGAWECVTGRVDQGEGFEDAVHREVAEELGVGIQLRFIVGTTHFFRGEPRPEKELIGVVYCGSVDDPEKISLSPEHSEARWVNAREARDLLSGSHPSEFWLLKVIERAELSKSLLPQELVRIHQQDGFELD